MKAKIRNTSIYFDIEGAGLTVHGDQMREKPAAFLIHGGPGLDHSTQKPGFSALCEDLQLVYFDHRGQGRSGRGPLESYNIENNVEDMDALRDYLGLERIVSIGTSYGGMVALLHACRYPERLSHLIVIVTAANPRFLTRAQEILKERGSPEQQRCAKRLFDGTFKTNEQLLEFFDVLGPLYSLNYERESAQISRKRAILSVDAINAAFGGFMRTHSVLDQLHKITVPTLVIGARHDWICAPEFSEEIAGKIPNAKLKIFENSGHGVRTDAPQELMESIRDFLKE